MSVKKILSFALLAVVFLTPLFFMPGTQEALEFPKQTFFVIMVGLCTLLWLIDVVGKGKLVYFKTPLHWILIAIPLAVLISAILGPDAYGALFGWGVQISSSFTNFLYMAFFAFLALHVWEGMKEVKIAAWVYITSVFIASVIGILQFSQTYLLRFDFARSNAFNTVSTANALGILAGSALLLSLGMFFAFHAKSWLKVRLPLLVSSLTFLFYLLLLGFKPVWYALGPCALVVLLLGFLHKKKVHLKLLMWWVGLIVISAIFSFVSIVIWQSAAAPAEVSLNQKTSWDIASATLQQQPIFGSGPGTFGYQFLKYKPVDLNATAFWNTRFGKGSSEFLSQLAMTGIAGVVSVLGFMIFALYVMLQKILHERSTNEEESHAFDQKMFEGSMLASMLYLVISYFLYPFSTVLWSSVFLIGVLMVVLARRENETTRREIELEHSPKVSIVVAFVFLVGIILNITVIYAMGRRYVAEHTYSTALASTDPEIAQRLFKDATELNPYFDFYWRDLGAFLYNRFTVTTAEPASEQGQQRMKEYLDESLRAINKAAQLNPTNSYAWSLRGSIYQNLIGRAEGADAFAIQSFNEGIARDPSNPFLYTELGKIYQLQFNLVLQNPQVPIEQKRQLAELALERYNKAISLKGDYAPALYQSAVILDLLGEQQEAIRRTETNRALLPNDSGIAFQLGVMYYKTKQFPKALVEFERAFTIDPNFSNARYFAGILYDQQGNREKAIFQFEEIEKSNPENSVVKTVLANLRANRPALGRGAVGEVIAPIEESPTRIPGSR